MQSFVTTIDLSLKDRILKDVQDQGFEITTPPHTFFSAKKKGVTLTLYTSGKLVVQGKESKEFIEFYLEPEILKALPCTHPHHSIDKTARIGVDEAGKGDFFGPLCIAGVFGGEKEIDTLLSLGVKDSKTMQDSTIRTLAARIRKNVPHHVVRIGPAKYNEIYPKFGNLNLLLAWGHATVIEALSLETGCQRALVDQFSDRPHVIQALKRKGLAIQFEQRTKAESDPVVAAASILARDAFLTGIDRLSEECGFPLPKGASAQVKRAAETLLQTRGIPLFDKIAKKHFKTFKELIS